MDLYRYIYRCVMRLHDVIYFTWEERHMLTLAGIKVIAVLAILGASIAAGCELYDQWKLRLGIRKRKAQLNIQRKKRATQKTKTNAYVTKIYEEGDDEDDGIQSVTAKIVDRGQKKIA